MSNDTPRRRAISVDKAPARQRRIRIFLLAVLALSVLGGSTTLSFYVDALWFESLGYASVFWTRLNLQFAAFGAFALVTFAVLYGAYLTCKPAQLSELIGGTIRINGQSVKLAVESVVQLIALGLSLAIAAATGAGMMARWTTLALFWNASQSIAVRRESGTPCRMP